MRQENSMPSLEPIQEETASSSVVWVRNQAVTCDTGLHSNANLYVEIEQDMGMDEGHQDDDKLINQMTKGMVLSMTNRLLCS